MESLSFDRHIFKERCHRDKNRYGEKYNFLKPSFDNLSPYIFIFLLSYTRWISRYETETLNFSFNNKIVFRKGESHSTTTKHDSFFSVGCDYYYIENKGMCMFRYPKEDIGIISQIFLCFVILSE